MMRLGAMFPLIFCALILVSPHFFWEFTQSFVFEIQSVFRVRNKVKTKKKKKRSSPIIKWFLCPK